jgi:alkaline phosphatase
MQNSGINTNSSDYYRMEYENDPIFRKDSVGGFTVRNNKTFTILSILGVIFSLICFVGLLSAIVVGVFWGIYGSAPQKKFVIFMVPDGYGPAAVTLARVVSQTPKLIIEQYLVGTARTFSSNSWVTDSAAGATAYASCIKTYNGAVGMTPDKKPIITMLEAAKLKNFKTGMVVTSRITHATPAAFSSHVIDRNSEFDIASQQITKKIDLMIGGGRNQYLPLEKGGLRPDGRDLIQEAQKLGYNYFGSLNDFNTMNVSSMPVLGLFNGDHMDYEIDRVNKSLAQPTLSQTTKMALNLLKQSCGAGCPGFVMLIEGSRIDHALHDNDAATAAKEAAAYDLAFGEVAQFAKDNNAFVVSVADHETGGLTLGRPHNYGQPGSDMFNWFPQPLRDSQASSERIYGMIRGGMDISQAIQSWQLVTPTLSQVQAINSSINDPYLCKNMIGKALCDASYVNFVHGQHTGVDVNIYSVGELGKTLVGNNNNIDLCTAVAKYLDLQMGIDPPK